VSGWGGARAGAGRKTREEEEAVGAAGRDDFEAQRARHEKIKADQREFKLMQERGEYLPREAQRQASATILAMLTQSLRSIPDNLERACNLTPEQAAQAQELVDNALTELANGLKAMVRDDE
jgi:molecular chaperone GrpE (heat shock protein)